MSSAKNSISRPRQLGIALTLIALALAGCGGGKSSNTPTNTVTPTPTPSVIPTAAIKITPMKGQFSTGTSVKIKRAKDSVEVGTCLVDATGSCSADIKTSEIGPFLIEAGVAGDKYFDESTGALATVPANTTALRALIPNATAAVGVTALTEMAVGQIEGNTGGIAAAKTTDVIAANATIGSQFGVPDPLITPAVIGAGTATAKLNGGNTADDYALKLAAIAKMTNAGGDPIRALHDLRDDVKDGVLDGSKNGVAITTLNVPAPTGTQTYQQAMNANLNNLLVVAATAYAAPGTAVPTVTMTVADLKVLLDAAMQVGAATQAASAGTAMATATLNTQIANTVQTQVSTLAVVGATAGTIQAGTSAAVAVGTAAGTTLGSAATAAQNFIAAAATGVYEVDLLLDAPAGSVLQRGKLKKRTMPLNAAGSSYNYIEELRDYSSATGQWTVQGNTIGGSYWDLTPTSAGGWVSTVALKFTVAADGTLTRSGVLADGSSIGNESSWVVTQVDLANAPVKGCNANAVGGPIPCTISPYGTNIYPAGSAGFIFSTQYQKTDVFAVDIPPGKSAATNMSGVALTALPALGDSFCTDSSGGTGNNGMSGGITVFEPVANPVTGQPNYTIKQSNVAGCTLANINSVAAQLGFQTYLFLKATGNSAAPYVLNISSGGNCWGCNAQIVAYIPTKGVFEGWMDVKGPVKSGNNLMANRIAFDAMITAARAVTGIAGMGAAVPTIP